MGDTQFCKSTLGVVFSCIGNRAGVSSESVEFAARTLHRSGGGQLGSERRVRVCRTDGDHVYSHEPAGWRYRVVARVSERASAALHSALSTARSSDSRTHLSECPVGALIWRPVRDEERWHQHRLPSVLHYRRTSEDSSMQAIRAVRLNSIFA